MGTDAGRETGDRIEVLIDELAATAYEALTAAELADLVAGHERLAATVS